MSGQRASLQLCGVSNGAVPVTAGVGTNNTASTLARLERAKALGADAGLLVFPTTINRTPMASKPMSAHP